MNGFIVPGKATKDAAMKQEALFEQSINGLQILIASLFEVGQFQLDQAARSELPRDAVDLERTSCVRSSIRN